MAGHGDGPGDATGLLGAGGAAANQPAPLHSRRTGLPDGVAAGPVDEPAPT
jgi:hypothetical protein